MIKRLILVLVAMCMVSAPVWAIEPGGKGKKDGKAGEAGKGEKKKKEKGLDKKPKFKVGARLHTMWMLTNSETDPANQFSIDMARVTFRWQQYKLIRVKLQADIDQLFKDTAKSLMRDAYVQIAPLKALVFRLGQFKRPFSRFELRSRGQLATVNRGPANEFLVEDLGFGDRDIGLQIHGRIGNKDQGFGYAVGVFNGTGKNKSEFDFDGSKDLVVRLDGGPAKWIEIGLNGSFKFFDTNSEEYRYYPDFAWMAGVDSRFKYKGLRVMAEGLLGQNYGKCFYDQFPNTCLVLTADEEVPLAWATAMQVSYKFSLTDKFPLKLQPVVKGGVFQPDTDIADGLVWTLAGGINLFITKWIRVMVHGEFIFAADELAPAWVSENRLLVQLAFDL